MLLALDGLYGLSWDVKVGAPLVVVLAAFVIPSCLRWRERFELDEAVDDDAVSSAAESCDHPGVYDWAREGLCN